MKPTEELRRELRPLDRGSAPRTTTISVRPSRVALTTMLKPESQMKPVFMPLVPG